MDAYDKQMTNKQVKDLILNGNVDEHVKNLENIPNQKVSMQ